MKPKLNREGLEALLHQQGLLRDNFPLCVVGVPGYYKNTMGQPGLNDRGIYDDAIFVLSRNAFAAFNGNVDPSSGREGMASLCSGVWPAYHFGQHRGKYLALVQRIAEVEVMRDQTKGFPKGKHEKYGFHLGAGRWRGWFGINIHRGAENSTSSLGCQTVPPDQWPAFIALVESEARRIHGKVWKAATIPYILTSRE